MIWLAAPLAGWLPLRPWNPEPPPYGSGLVQDRALYGGPMGLMEPWVATS